jgi:hypothetical protein
MGFNKKYISEIVIEKLILNPELIEVYLRTDSLIFDNGNNKKKFEEIANEYFKRQTFS